MFVRDPKYADLPDIEDQIFEAEARLQENWQDASDQLDQCRPEEPVKR